MRSATLTLLVLLLVLPVPVQADEGQPTALELVETLLKLTRDEKASWGDKAAAHKAAKARLDDKALASVEAATKALKDESFKDDAEKAAFEQDIADNPAEARYLEIRSEVADGLRRDTLPVMGWIMGFFGASLLWGGFAVCVAIARKSGKAIDPHAE